MAAARKGRGKSGLHGLTVPDNVRRGRPQGKCHRKQTTASPEAARVKRCGKSAPREQQCERHGKPHREQDRIGTTCMATCRAFPACRPGWLPEAAGNGRPRGMAITPHPARAAALQNPAYRPTGGSAGGWCQSADFQSASSARPAVHAGTPGASEKADWKSALRQEPAPEQTTFCRGRMSAPALAAGAGTGRRSGAVALIRAIHCGSWPARHKHCGRRQ